MAALRVPLLLLLFVSFYHAQSIQFPIEFENVAGIPGKFKSELKKSPIESGVRDEPSEACVNVTLHGFGHEEEHKLQVNLDVSVAWKDERVNLTIPWKGNRRRIWPKNPFWYPNITLENSKLLEMEAWIGYLYEENEFNVTHQGIQVELDCHLHYHWFPFDCHLCQFGLKFSEETKHVQIMNSDLTVTSPLVVPQWIIWTELDIATFQETSDDDADEAIKFSGLKLEFLCRRNLLLYFWQIYIPSTLLCIAANGALFIPSDLVPGRMTLSVTSFLSLVALFSGARLGQNYWPQASYVNAMDVWQIICYLIVFLILCEYCIVLHLTKIPDWKLKIDPKIRTENQDKIIRRLKKAQVLESSARTLIPFLTLAFMFIYMFTCFLQFSNVNQL